MAFFIRGERRIWVGDLRWRSFQRSPSLMTVHKVASEFNSNYFVQSRTYPQHVGFLSADNVDTKESLQSLALAVSEKFGGRYYGEYEVGIDQYWVIATDEEGLPLPGSDGVYREEAVEAVRSTFSGYPFEQKDVLSSREFEKLLDDLPDAPLKVRSTSLAPLYTSAAIVVSIFIFAVTAWYFYHQHIIYKRRELARQALLENAKRVPKIIAKREPPASEWIDGCLSMIPASPFAAGWTLDHATCKNDVLDLHWYRAGGNMADAPDGELMNNGDAIVTHRPLSYTFKRRQNTRPDYNERTLIGILQRGGVTPALNSSKLNLLVDGRQVPTETTRMSFTLQTDPRDIPWDAFEDLRITSLSRSVLPAQSTSRTATWQMQISFTHTLKPLISTLKPSVRTSN
ncbi:MAG: type 4b pilus protein PilO2 [Acetobacter sp.]|jgi:hypothetical protein|nr:type 4b pilus protein PilO2 [Acetobacter sp.]MCI1485837.1 type 4b pilus protein PilO2 [Acetobacter sp.]MCI1529781.1 type 4b pilus protein PilO2 [Acetobacter sp.]MCI1587550.1 type 4b pilus protein PilO2 [Acetobacter sp.]MCI1601767.1 type 4b pilus protein PilO2 [Acetobacter sp.]